MKKIILILLVFLCCISCEERVFRTNDIFIVYSKELNSSSSKYKYKYEVINYFIKNNSYVFNNIYTFFSNENYELNDTIVFNKLQKEEYLNYGK